MIPEEAPQEEPGFGHNVATMLVVEKDRLSTALYEIPRDGRTFSERRGEFLRSIAAQRVRDRQSAGDAADTIKMANEVWALILAMRMEQSEPFRQVHLALAAAATEFWEPVVEAIAGLREQIDAWTAQEDDRIAVLKREQDAEMARWRQPAASAPRAVVDYSAAPAAPPPPPSSVPQMRPTRRHKIHGDLGATISAKANVTYEIEDISLIPDHIMQSQTVKDAILTVVRQTARHFGVPAGIKVHQSTGNQIR